MAYTLEQDEGDIAEHTLSLEIKKAMAEIPELKDISQGTQVGNIVYMYLIVIIAKSNTSSHY